MGGIPNWAARVGGGLVADGRRPTGFDGGEAVELRFQSARVHVTVVRDSPAGPSSMAVSHTVCQLSHARTQTN